MIKFKKFLVEYCLFNRLRTVAILMVFLSWCVYGIIKGGFLTFALGQNLDDVYATVMLIIGISFCCYGIVEILLKAYFFGFRYILHGEDGCLKKVRKDDVPSVGKFFGGLKSKNGIVSLVFTILAVMGLVFNAIYFYCTEDMNFAHLLYFCASTAVAVLFILNTYPIAYRILDVLVLLLCITNLIYLLEGYDVVYSDPRILNLLQQSSPLKDALACPFNNFSFLIIFRLIVEDDNRRNFIQSFLYGSINKVLVVIGSLIAITLVIASFYNWGWNWLIFVDASFTLVFIIELGLKIYEEGKFYFIKDNPEEHTGSILTRKIHLDWWNILDAFVILCSITSFFMMADKYRVVGGMFAIILFRLVRVLKLFRILKLFQRDLAHLVHGIKDATLKSIPIVSIFVIALIFLGFALYFAQVNLHIGGEDFKDPISAIFSLFRLFTYDGWHDIPTQIAKESVAVYPDIWWIDGAVRIGFCLLVFAGGIVGVALLNSVFVDGMLGREKSDEIRIQKIDRLNAKIDELNMKLNALEGEHFKLH